MARAPDAKRTARIKVWRPDPGTFEELSVLSEHGGWGGTGDTSEDLVRVLLESLLWQHGGAHEGKQAENKETG